MAKKFDGNYDNAAMQNADELAWFINIIRREGVKRYLEIGSRFGGSLWKIACALPTYSTVVSVDMPQDPLSRQTLEQCHRKIENELGLGAHLLIGDSTDPIIVEKVRSLAIVPFDLCLIDANHTLQYVTKDWENYGPMARIVAFHDINWKGPRPGKMMIDVPEFWNEIKSGYRFEEIRREPRDNGFGVLWRS